MAIKLITDMSAGLTPEQLKKYDIFQIPINQDLHFRAEKRTESYPNESGDLLPVEDFYGLMDQYGPKNLDVMTSKMSAEAVIECIEPFLKNGNDIIVLGITRSMSSLADEEIRACDILREQYHERQICYRETHCISGGLGFMVTRVANFMQQHDSIDDILDYIDHMSHHTEHIFSIGDYEWLKKGGRGDLKTMAKYSIAGTMHIRPFMRLPYDTNFKLVTDDKARGFGKLFDKFAAYIKDTAKPDSELWLCYGNVDREADVLKRKITEQRPDLQITIGHIDPIIGSHVGPKVIATFYERTTPRKEHEN